MTRRVPLREIAHARAGDKGDISNVSVWVYDPVHYPVVKAQLTAERLAAAYPQLIRGQVARYEVDHLHGLNFVLHDALEGGVNSSLNLDSHGKSWSFLLLALEIELDEGAGDTLQNLTHDAVPAHDGDIPYVDRTQH